MAAAQEAEGAGENLSCCWDDPTDKPLTDPPVILISPSNPCWKSLFAEDPI